MKQKEVGWGCFTRRCQSNRHIICEHSIQAPEICIASTQAPLLPLSHCFTATLTSSQSCKKVLCLPCNTHGEEPTSYAAHQKKCIHWCFLSLRSFMSLCQKNSIEVKFDQWAHFCVRNSSFLLQMFAELKLHLAFLKIRFMETLLINGQSQPFSSKVGQLMPLRFVK